MSPMLQIAIFTEDAFVREGTARKAVAHVWETMA